ncbi:aminoglycoside 6-adenylyltransferase [Haloplasma contractile]|uniref:Aminoglycoside 6-adenylyltransferase protein n=1 Tax=Haloplasma contractile SSD-17B TaxID=1033810 RepID=F7Q1X5_9MOLU|nr:aminoglycoside 6-adenylyltransferase [Haloplasma contractile]ERJ12212.1 Aminoglycoside 6-adenylyltransferase protein [Haloplasma contractile SSD-17B]
MRTEQEMFDLILNVAKNDERIRAVYMNGSRINTNIQKDIFQDYDIVFVVTETKPFIEDENWINVFGELLMVQEPDKNDHAIGMDVNFNLYYGYLMLFKDGNRIDLHLETKEAMLAEYGIDSLTLPLLDKDHCLPPIQQPSDIDYWVNTPTEPLFTRNCNNFWWCIQNVAKGIWRRELPFAKQMFDRVIKDLLDEMVSWWIGSQHGFEISVGKMGKYFEDYLPEVYWNLYKRSYSDSNYNHLWDSVFATCDLYRLLSKDIATQFKFKYPIKDDKNMTEFLKHIRSLPHDAEGIY